MMQNSSPIPILDKQRTDRNRKIIAGCIIAFFIFLFVSILIFSLLFIYYRNVSQNTNKSNKTNSSKTSNTPELITPSSTTQSDNSSSYPVPDSCSQVQTPDSQALAISLDSPGVKKNLNNHYYSIYGYNRYDLREQVNACGPKTDEGAFTGLTTAWFNWTYQFAFNNQGECTVSKSAVGVNVDIYYPNWEIKGDTENGLTDEWNAFMNNLVIHEQGHMQRHYDIADQIYNSILGLSAPSCDEVDSTAQTVVNNLMEQDRTSNVAYDAQTDHGATQGAILP